MNDSQVQTLTPTRRLALFLGFILVIMICFTWVRHQVLIFHLFCNRKQGGAQGRHVPRHAVLAEGRRPGGQEGGDAPLRDQDPLAAPGHPAGDGRPAQDGKGGEGDEVEAAQDDDAAGGGEGQGCRSLEREHAAAGLARGADGGGEGHGPQDREGHR